MNILCTKCTNTLWSRGKVLLYCGIEPDVHVGGYWSAKRAGGGFRIVSIA